MSRAWISRCLRELWGKMTTRYVARSAHPWSKSPFLDLPEEVVLLIISLLPRLDKLSAALTCKPLHFISNSVFDTGLVSQEDKEDFLLRLERDLMATHHYCAICIRLHKFSSLNKPNEDPYIVLEPNIPPCLGFGYLYSPIFAENYFAYHHGRAAMNRHFHGAPAGLDPDLLCYETSHKDFDDQYGLITWSSRYSVRIICDSLHLSGKHIMDSTTIPSMITKLNEGVYDICHHTTTSALPYLAMSSERAAGLDACEISRLLQEPGCVVHGSCARCLTDYTVEITQNCSGREIFYRVEIQTYHDFGQFRSPEEWKWRAWRHKMEEYGSVKHRDMEVYPPGSVYRQYCVAEGEDDKRLEISV